MLLSIPVTGLLVLSLLCVLLPFVDVLSVLCGAFARLVLWWSDLFAVPNGVLLPLNDAWSITILILMTAVIAVLAVVRLRRFVCLLIPPALFLVAVCVSLCVTRWGFSDMHVDVIQTGHGNLYLYTEDGKALLINDADGAVAKDYEIKQAALAQRCTVIDDAVICRYYNQATYFIGSLSESIYLQRLHLPTPSNAREAAIAARLAEEASHYGIEVLITKLRDEGFLYDALLYRSSCNSFGSRSFISLNQSTCTEQCTSKIANYNNQYISKITAIYLP